MTLQEGNRGVWRVNCPYLTAALNVMWCDLLPAICEPVWHVWQRVWAVRGRLPAAFTDSRTASDCWFQGCFHSCTFCPLFTTSLKTSRPNDMGTIISSGGVPVQCQESEVWVWQQWNREILAETFREEDGLSRRHQRESRGKKVGEVCGRVSLTQPYTSVSNSHRTERERVQGMNGGCDRYVTVTQGAPTLT